MILGFKTDLNKYYQSKVVKNKNRENQREWCAKFNISFTQEKKKTIFEGETDTVSLIKAFQT
jgi:hypothetical protein